MTNSQYAPTSAQNAVTAIRSLVCDAIKSVVVLEDDRVVENLLVALAVGGHILLDDVPGVGKTLLARTFAAALGLGFKRIQFTPDLLPTDVTGLNYYNQKSGQFEFRPGPVFTQVLLADEINRATPRTQASLLECMQEASVSVDGETRPLARPFLVIATQNPVEMEGTFPLPEAQLDRFLLCLKMGYPSLAAEREIAVRFLGGDPLARVKPVLTPEHLQVLSDAVSATHFASPVLEYALSIARVTREMKEIRLGVSPRGALSLARASRALATIRGRHFVLPDDVQDMAQPVLGHRFTPDIDSSLYGTKGPDLVHRAVQQVPVPVGDFAPELP